MSDFDVIVIGAGPAGYEVASLLSEGGKKVCIIEKHEEQIGGTCLNEGCIPAKNFLESASYVKKNEYFKKCGVELEYKSFDIDKLKSSTNELIETLKGGILGKLKKDKVEIKYGEASFVGENSIAINGDVISADNIVIATGSSHRNHPLMDLHEETIISSREVFSLTSMPKSVLVVGGGAIGCEFASFFASFGVEVEIAEFTAKLVPIEDDDISRTLKRELEKAGIKVYLKTNITSYDIQENGVEVELDLGKKQEVKSYDKILVSIGRVPNTKNLELEKAHVKSENGFVEVNEDLRSVSNENVYAIGDVIKTPALAHVAYYEAKRVAKIILDEERLPSKTIFPSVTFCTPQIASIGVSEKELKDNGVEFKSKKMFFKSNGKAKIKGDDSGFMKINYDINTNQILGVAIIGQEATEIIHQFLIAINAKVTLDDLRQMIFAHPTLSEIILL